MAWLGGGVFALTLGLGGLGLVFAAPASRLRHEITLSAQNVPLSEAAPQTDRVGALRFMGGLSLESKDRDFGGLSGLIVAPGPEGMGIIAITDQGDKFSGRLVWSGSRLAGLEDAVLEPLLDTRGEPIEGKQLGDAESLTRRSDGSVLVGFERRHRIWAYGPDLSGPARLLETPTELQKAPSNNGLEALASWPDGRVLAITQGLLARADRLVAFLLDHSTWRTLEWQPTGPGLEPADATALPNGDLLVLERSWSGLTTSSITVRVTRVRAGSWRSGSVLKGEVLAELKAPLAIDNFEGLTAFTNAAGHTQILMVSDDNFSPIQRTLLLSFEMPD